MTQDTRIITVSGRIGAGSTTLANGISHHLGWKHIEGGEIFWEAIRSRMQVDAKDTNLRPDEEDSLFDAQLKKILAENHNIVLETKLAAFNAQGISGVYKILVVCENHHGEDQPQIRIDRLVNREGKNVEDAKQEVLEREKNDLAKWRHMYAHDDKDWVYFDPKYYDLVINTFEHSKEETLKIVLESLEQQK
ncbi:MAG: AAA family ATPase [Candidatus Levyibacteriota bacterium]